ncbi:response regulator transcription factor [Methanococcoides seepicolus]|uniref:Response regulator n=1 Tax=Methanococcoides seepicolus TaxID=2828780 RepID=A0A9E5DA79_9EURY|nr:response regulator [Methanococcoides seepicolus]MCM1985752.1 response regulator [Methanococcoides seepicolus]
MSEEETTKIIETLCEELASKNTLMLAPLNVFSERMIYFYTYSALKCNPEKNIVWLCLKTSRKHVLEKFEEYGFKINDHIERMWFIDIEGPGKNDPNTFYCGSATDYIKIGSHASRIFDDKPGSIMVLDDLTVLSKDNLQVVENFIKFLERKVRDSQGSIISMLGKGILPPETEGLMRSFFDIIIDITEKGNFHTDIGMKSLDVHYTIVDGKIDLEYTQKKIDKERLKILVVDDEPDIPELIRLSLATEPYDFIVAYNGEDAVKKSIEELPDLILLDIMMPDMDGYEVVERLKEDPYARDIAVIMVSAKTEIEDKLKGMELGIDDYISKPFDKREINARIKMVMKRFGWEPELAEQN